MDFSYILFNTLIYGSIGLVMSSYFAYGKFINFSIGAFVGMMGYIIYGVVNQWFTVQNIFMICSLIIIYRWVNRALIKYFPNTKQRDHVGLVITIGLNVFVQNMVNYVYGPSSIGLHLFTTTPWILLIMILVISWITYYLLKGSLIGKVYTSIEENTQTTDSLGIKSTKLLHQLFGWLFWLLVVNALFIINETNLKATDGVFYLIKWIWIMILVGVGKKEYIFVWALLYVLLEYFLFITLWLPIAYKETLVLIIILWVLLWKPEWLFMIRRRKI